MCSLLARPFVCECHNISAVLRFHFPLIKPDVQISCIRLSDWFPPEAHNAAVKTESPSSPLGKVASETLDLFQVDRLSPILRPLSLPTTHQNQGPFARPALPGVLTTTGLSATPRGPVGSSRNPGCRSRANTAGASRVACRFLLKTCRRHYPGGTGKPQSLGPSLSKAHGFPTAAFPIWRAGRLPHYPFRGLLDVHSRYGLPAR